MKQVASSPLQMQKGGGVSKACQSNSSSAEEGETDGPVSAASVTSMCATNWNWNSNMFTGAYMAFVTWVMLHCCYVI